MREKIISKRFQNWVFPKKRLLFTYLNSKTSDRNIFILLLHPNKYVFSPKTLLKKTKKQKKRIFQLLFFWFDAKILALQARNSTLHNVAHGIRPFRVPCIGESCEFWLLVKGPCSVRKTRPLSPFQFLSPGSTTDGGYWRRLFSTAIYPARGWMSN